MSEPEFTEDPPVEFILDDGRKVIRKGYCNGCGWCCENIAQIGIDGRDQEDEEYAKARNLPLDGTIKWIAVHDPCPLLTAAKKCGIYANRPRTCKEFPIHPDQIIDTPCSYRFEDEDGNPVE